MAATDLAQEGGPEAVVLRQAARQVGVSATAAYRHFAGHGDLIHEVKERCQAALAEHMHAEVDAEEPVAEPRLFRTAFCHADTPREQGFEMIESPAFAMLTDVLDELMSLGLIAPADRPYTEMVAWSSAHGLAALLVDGPLGWLPEELRDAAVKRALDAT